MYKTKLKWHPQIIKITYSIFLPHPKGRGSEQQDILQAGVQVNELTEYTHIHLFIYIYRDYLFVCPPIVPFSNTSLPYSSVTAPYVFICYYVFYILSPLCLYVFMSFCLPFLCYHVFYILYPFGHSVFRSSVTMSFTYSVPYVFMSFWLINVKYFHHLPILSVTCEWQVGQYPPFLSRTFRNEFVSIKNTIVYKIK